MLTLVPWRGRALIGTGQSDEFRQPADTATVSRAEIEAFVAERQRGLPGAAPDPRRRSGSSIAASCRPCAAGTDAPSSSARLRFSITPTKASAGAMTVVGVKYTTARARRPRASCRRPRSGWASVVPPSQTERRILPGAGIADHEALTIETARAVGLELAPPIIRHLTGVYGDRCAAHHQAHGRAHRLAHAARRRSAARRRGSDPYDSSGDGLHAGRHRDSPHARLDRRAIPAPQSSRRSRRSQPKSSGGTPTAARAKSRRSTASTSGSVHVDDQA